MPLQQTQITQRGSQSSQVAVTELQKQQLTQSSGQIIGQQQSCQVSSNNDKQSWTASDLVLQYSIMSMFWQFVMWPRTACDTLYLVELFVYELFVS